MPAPELTRRDTARVPEGLILMLHGGRADGLTPVDQKSASWRRSSWMMDQIGGRANRAGISVWLLRYQVRGWNARVATPPSPVPDARWALDEVRRELGQLPVVLLGHSMGARTAVAVADDPSVLGVVAVAPWLPKGEPVEPLTGRHLVAAHGPRDRITRYKDTKYYVERAREVAASATLTTMEGLGHYMLKGRGRWNDFAAESSLRLLG